MSTKLKTASRAGGDRSFGRNVIVAVIAFVAFLIAAVFIDERVNDRISWHLPDGGRISLSRPAGKYVLSRVGPRGQETRFPSDAEVIDAELRTDDRGSYWLVSKEATPRVVDFFCASDGMYIGTPPPPSPVETFTPDSGRVLSRSMWFGFW
jgi:hypothetical protein